jgi:hypothetical protein
LGELIQASNLVPPKLEMPKIEDLAEILGALPQGTDAPMATNIAALTHFFEQHFPPEKCAPFYEALGPMRSDRWNQIVDRYIAISRTHALLAAIADHPHQQIHGDRIKIPIEAAQFIHEHLQIDTDGKIEIKPSPLLEMLKGAEAERIRRCSECKRIFWAGRVDKFACTRQCVTQRRVRLWRERYPNHYKLQRYKKPERLGKRSTRSKGSGRGKSQ